MGNPGSFCGKCGAAFGPQDRFCGACGAPRAVAPAAAPPPIPQVPFEAFAPPPRPPVPPPPPAAPIPSSVASGGEWVLGVVPQVVLVKGFLGAKTVFLNLVVTDQRLIFAQQSEDMWDQMDALEKQLKADFDDYEGDWRSFMASRDFSAAPWQGVLAQPPDQLLMSLGRGFVVPLGEVQSVHVTLRADTDPDFCNSTLLIHGGTQSWDLELPWGNGDEARRLLSRVVAQVTVEGPEEA
ncbi:MAG: hypothetical protein AB2L07_11420 [Thermoanaerobaculaceae bacterium]